MACWFTDQSMEHVDENILINPQAVDSLSKQTIALTPSYGPAMK